MAARKKKSFKLEPQMLAIIIIVAVALIVLISMGTVQTAKFYYAQGQKSIQLPITASEKSAGTEAKPAVVVLCQDPDGVDFATQGWCKDAKGEYADFCAPLGELQEYYCVTTTADGSGEKTACAQQRYLPAYGKCVNGQWIRGDVKTQ